MTKKKLLTRTFIAFVTAFTILCGMGFGAIDARATVSSVHSEYIQSDGNYAQIVTDIYKQGYESAKTLAGSALWDNAHTGYKPGTYVYAFDHPAIFDSDACLSVDKATRTLNKAAGIVQSVKGTTKFEKALALHDKLMAVTKYDSRGVNGEQTAYAALIGGKAACNGYAMAYKLLCDLSDIPCYVVVGTGSNNGGSENHAWNVIQLDDGAWYEVDVTWDDQLGNHEFFGLTTAQMKKYTTPSGIKTSHVRRTTEQTSNQYFKTELELIYKNVPVATGTKYCFFKNYLEKDGLYFEITNKSKKIVKVIGISDKQKKKKAAISLDNVTVKGKKYTVTEIGSGALEGSKLSKVTIGKSVSVIGAEAFLGCSNLKTVNINSAKLKTVGTDAFSRVAGKVKFSCPKAKLKAYKKLLKAAGAPKTASYK